MTRLSLLALLVLLPVGCGSKKPALSPSGDEGGYATAPAKTDPHYRYLPSIGCSGCHPQQYAQWKHSLHAQAHSEPIYDYYFMRASRDSGRKLETFCGRCHTPLGVRSKRIPFKHALTKAGDTQLPKPDREGLSCDVCHTMGRLTGIGNGGFALTPSSIKRGSLAAARPVSHRSVRDRNFRRAELCGACHEVTHPGNGIALETTYSEWKKGPYAKAGIICQDCHMTAGLVPPLGPRIGKPPRHAGKAALQGPERPHVSLHYFHGPNLVFSRAPGREKLRALSEALLRRAARVSFGSPTRTATGLELIVRVTNTGAGHSIPTGVTELRQLWLEVTLTDAAGQVRFHSGRRDSQGNLAPGTVIYRTHVADAQGRDTTLFWNAVRKVSDHRIPPRETVTETYRVTPLPPGAYTLEAALHYRSVSPRGLAEAGVPRGAIDIPIFTMHRNQRRLTVGPCGAIH